MPTDTDLPDDRRPDNPREWTYQDYREVVDVHAEAALEALQEDPDEFDPLHEAVAQSVDGAREVNNYGLMLVTVLMSETNPDTPDHVPSWDQYADHDGRWSDAVSAMAYVCLYDDVMDRARRLAEERGLDV